MAHQENELFAVRGLHQALSKNSFPSFVKDYNFELPEELIAQEPAQNRSDAKLLVVRRNPEKGVPKFEDLLFSDLPSLCASENLSSAKWIRNRTRVFKARFYAKRPSGSKHEIVLVREISDNRWEAIIRNQRRFNYPQTLLVDANETIEFVSPEPGILDFGKSLKNAHEICGLYGEMPLPPYIKKRDKDRDSQRYQTIWANTQEAKSVAAPTASLHFTEQICHELVQQGVDFIDIELDVGLGTFEPLRHDNIHENILHKERFQVSKEYIEKINLAFKNDKPLLCIGTTTMRCLESLGLGKHQHRANHIRMNSQDDLVGETQIFIKPGTDILYTSKLITNFHLPESSLFMLVATFAGSMKLAQEAYSHATRNKYRFFSYGDATIWL